MSELLAHGGQWLILALGWFLFAFLIPFKSFSIIEGGKEITPPVFRFLRWGAVVFLVGLLIWGMGTVSSFLVQVTLRSMQDMSNLVATAAVVLAGVSLFFLGKALGAMVAQNVLSKRLITYFQQDELAGRLLEDINRGVFEVRIYPMRLEGLRSFLLDIDGLNKPAYSIWGCRQLAWYLKKTSGVDYTIQDCYADDGLQARGNVSVIQNGRRFRFSHVSMVKNG